MARPLNKTQLFAAIQKEFDALEKFLAGLSQEQFYRSLAADTWAVKDFIAHLYEWQQMFFTWYETGLRGETPAVPAPGFKWNQLPALNQQIFEKYRGLTHEQALALFHESHRKTLQLIENLPDTDLATPGLYAWMNQNTLLAYLNSTTAAHYNWALKEIKKVLNN